MRLCPEALPLATRLRLRPDVEVLVTSDAVWIRGPSLDDELCLVLRALPSIARYAVGERSLLFEEGHRVPNGPLPDGDWRPLAAFFALDAPPPLLPAVSERLVSLALVRTTVGRPTRLLLCELDVWVDYAVTAPEIRLDGLVFAASDDRRVLVRSTGGIVPTPPIPGRHHVEEQDIAWPAGFSFSPAVGAAVIRRRLGIPERDLALFDEDGSYELVPACDFVRASRAAARATREALR